MPGLQTSPIAKPATADPVPLLQDEEGIDDSEWIQVDSVVDEKIKLLQQQLNEKEVENKKLCDQIVELHSQESEDKLALVESDKVAAELTTEKLSHALTQKALLDEEIQHSNTRKSLTQLNLDQQTMSAKFAIEDAKNKQKEHTLQELLAVVTEQKNHLQSKLSVSQEKESTSMQQYEDILAAKRIQDGIISDLQSKLHVMQTLEKKNSTYIAEITQKKSVLQDLLQETKSDISALRANLVDLEREIAKEQSLSINLALDLQKFKELLSDSQKSLHKKNEQNEQLRTEIKKYQVQDNMSRSLFYKPKTNDDKPFSGTSSLVFRRKS